MPKCPHCGEPVRVGQEQCFACDQRIPRARLRQRSSPVNPAVFIAAGAAVIVAVLGLLILLPKEKQQKKTKQELVELTRIRDSVRKANIELGTDGHQDRETAQLSRELDKLEQRFQQVQQQVIGQRPTPEQSKLVTQISPELVRFRTLVSRIALANEDGRKAITDSVREGERNVRTLISQLTRAPKNP